MKKQKNLMSVLDYAAACGVGKAAIYLRAKNGELSFELFGRDYFVNVSKYPPVMRKKSGRKPASEYLQLNK